MMHLGYASYNARTGRHCMKVSHYLLPLNGCLENPWIPKPRVPITAGFPKLFSIAKPHPPHAGLSAVTRIDDLAHLAF